MIWHIQTKKPKPPTMPIAMIGQMNTANVAKAMISSRSWPGTGGLLLTLDTKRSHTEGAGQHDSGPIVQGVRTRHIPDHARPKLVLLVSIAKLHHGSILGFEISQDSIVNFLYQQPFIMARSGIYPDLWWRDRRTSGSPARRTPAVELAICANADQWGRLTLAAITAVFNINHVAKLLGEDEDWLHELSIDMFP
jgi:hypothetical protein